MTEVKKKLTREEAKARFVQLSWKILEWKFLYYEGAKYGLKSIPDETFDKHEATYRKLAGLLKLEPTAAEKVGFPWDTGSGRLVADKLIAQAKNKKGS